MTDLFKSAVVQGWGHTDPELKNTSRASRFPIQTMVSLLTTKQCKHAGYADKLEEVRNIYDMLFCAYKAMADSCVVGI